MPYIEPTVVNVRTYIAIQSIIDVAVEHFNATGCPMIQASDLKAAFPAEAAKRGLGIRNHWIASILDEFCRYGIFRFYAQGASTGERIEIETLSFRMTSTERERAGIQRNTALYVALHYENVIGWLRPAVTVNNDNFNAIMNLDRSIMPTTGGRRDLDKLKRDSAHGMAVIRAGHALWKASMVPLLQDSIAKVEDLMARTEGLLADAGVQRPTLAICPICRERIAPGISRNEMQSAIQVSSGAVTSTGFARDRAVAYLHVACANSIITRKFTSREARIEALGLFGASTAEPTPEVALGRVKT